ncbi:Multicopper oxidase [Lachnellula willkommii]|uniref:Multicopper oxidase n=1 Tax=Lachnellula willkommii TaxID=215461 RepID=A0A559M603_9HELO|nr:Multicopper oxidase [Lachnellula willkommii]
MAKPLISSTFLSFPKLLLWSLPLLFILLYTYVGGGLGLRFPTLVSFISPVEQAVTSTIPTKHGPSFSPDYSLRVTEQPFTQSCITKDRVILVNGTSPGPGLRLTEGNIYWIRHWHGLSMAASPFSDGTPGASQWPIPPNHYFDYELDIGSGTAGTYFYHSHIGFQAVTAAGPLIVEEVRKPPFEYDDERIIALSDIFEKSDSEIEDGLVGNPFQWSGETSNILVNGQGQLQGSTTSAGCALATISVEPDKTYRFRFIGGTALSFVSLAFEDHKMILIEADGNYVKPVNISHLQIGSGQRFSVLFKTKRRSDVSKSQFFLQMETRDRPSLTRSYAVLEYQLANSKRAPRPKPSPLTLPTGEPPLTLPSNTFGWLDYKLLSLPTNPDFPKTSEVTRRITIRTHQIIGNGSIMWAQDDSPWIESFPQEPYLVSLYKNDSMEFPSLDRATAHQGIDPITRVFPAAIGEVIEIIIQNTGSDVGSVDVHPFHAHGAHYYDLGSGNGTYDPVANEELIKGLNLAQRDTTMLYKYAEKTTPGFDMGWRAWRLRVTEPGVWMIHCHILQHMVMGMQTVWVMGNETEVLNIPLEHIQGYLNYGGSVNGNDTHDPHVVHFAGGGGGA